MEKNSKNVSTILLIIAIIAILCLASVIIVQQNKINQINNKIIESNDNQNVVIAKSGEEVKDTENIVSGDEIEDTNVEGDNNEDTSKLRKLVVKIDTSNVDRSISQDDTNVDYDIFYEGIKITEKVGMHSVGWEDGIKGLSNNLAKYNKTYYSYESNGYMREIKEPKFESGIIGEDSSFISNLARIAVSKKYDVMPRTIEYNFEYYDDKEQKLYDFYNKINDYYNGRELFRISQPDDLKVDLNGDGNPIYIRLSVEKVFIEVELDGEKMEENIGVAFNYDAFDKDGNHLDTLLSQVYDINYLRPDADTSFSSLRESNSVTCADLDNDSKMEILIEAPWYEFGSDVYVYKYENGKIIGNTGEIHYVSA